MEIELIRADITSLKVDAMVNPAESPFDDTPGGNLLCRFVVHVVAPHRGDAAGLEAATQKALERAEELAVASIALPAFWPAPEDATACAQVMLPATMSFGSKARSLRRVVYTLFGQESFDAFQRVLREIKR